GRGGCAGRGCCAGPGCNGGVSAAGGGGGCPRGDGPARTVGAARPAPGCIAGPGTATPGNGPNPAAVVGESGSFRVGAVLGPAGGACPVTAPGMAFATGRAAGAAAAGASTAGATLTGAASAFRATNAGGSEVRRRAPRSKISPALPW